MIKMIIWEVSQFAIFEKKKKIKNQKFVNCTFIIQKLSTGGRAQVNGRTILISSWKCNFSIYLDIHVYYLDIQAITTLLCLLLILYVLFPSIHLFFYPTTTLLQSFPAFNSLLLPQFSTYRHRTGFNVKRKRVRITNSRLIYKLVSFNFFIIKVAYFAP